jgi:hypothetical protein
MKFTSRGEKPYVRPCFTGLPDGLFSNQKSQFGSILDGLAKENLDIFYDHFVYFTAIGNILWPFGIFCGNLVYLSPFWYFGPRKIWQPGCFTKELSAMP